MDNLFQPQQNTDAKEADKVGKSINNERISDRGHRQEAESLASAKHTARTISNIVDVVYIVKTAIGAFFEWILS